MQSINGIRSTYFRLRNQGSRVIRSAALLLLFLCVEWLGVPIAQAGEARVLRFAMSAESPPSSYELNGEARGIIRELLEELFASLPEYRVEFLPLPWGRAQLEVANGRLDGFCTFPSDTRKAYARFAAKPMYVWDYGNLVYSRDNARGAVIAQAKSFDDLRNLLFISQESVDWERENVPGFIRRYPVNTPSQMIHMLFRRGAGDFIIMSPEQARYYAHQFGYTEQLRSAKVDFIPNSQVEFHIGLRKTLPDAEQIIARIDAAMATPAFQARREQIINQYRTASIH
jgi:polar amino acid transport system substrate-binding protein